MPSTLVHAGFALLLAAGLLGTAYDRRALVVLLVVVVVPEADTVAGIWIDGAHRALGHNLTIPIVVGVALYWDTRLREPDESWLRSRWGAWGVRVAWVGLFVHLFAHVLLDYAHLEGINVLYPVYDRFFRLEGEILFSTAEGFVQTFVEIERDAETVVADVGGGGTTGDTHVANPVEPSADPDDGPIDRRFPIAEAGWQLYLLLVGPFVLLARRLQDRDGEE